MDSRESHLFIMKLNTFPKWCPYIRKQDRDILHIYDPFLRSNFYICAGTSKASFKKHMASWGMEEQDLKDGKFFLITKHGTEIGVIYSKDKTRTLIHECLHASVWALNKAGIPISYEADEILAYYQEFLFKWATKK